MNRKHVSATIYGGIKSLIQDCIKECDNETLSTLANDLMNFSEDIKYKDKPEEGDITVTLPKDLYWRIKKQATSYNDSIATILGRQFPEKRYLSLPMVAELMNISLAQLYPLIDNYSYNVLKTFYD